jgi:hypothetical protein
MYSVATARRQLMSYGSSSAELVSLQRFGDTSKPFLRWWRISPMTRQGLRQPISLLNLPGACAGHPLGVGVESAASTVMTTDL